jgi:DNA-binding NarL/FixJ family response regulator
MDEANNTVRERIRLVSTNPMRIAGFQGVYGDPCGVEITPVSLTEALYWDLPSILLIDGLSVSPLFEVLGKFRQTAPRVHLIVMGRDADETFIECVIAAGAKGFLGATAPAEEFRVALENVRDGSIWAPRKVLANLIGRQGAHLGLDRRAAAVELTPREDEVLALLLGGKGNREIGEDLGIDPVTVKAHLGRIMRKAGVGNRIALTMYALKRRSEDPTLEGNADWSHNRN